MGRIFGSHISNQHDIRGVSFSARGSLEDIFVSNFMYWNDRIATSRNLLVLESLILRFNHS